MKIVISSGHGSKIRGASGYLDEVDEARRVVEKVADLLDDANVDIEIFHDDISTSQSENLERIVNYHNSKTRDLDISVHFNAYQTTSKPMGVECLYVTQESLSDIVSTKISQAGGFLNRGPKYRSDLYFLNNTEMPAILIETCFVDSSTDADLYRKNFDAICQAIAEAVSGKDLDEPEEQPPKPPEEETNSVMIQIRTSPGVKVTVNGVEVPTMI
jgi:N-acetylmuramoyl-L-alanine amidase